MMFSAAREPAPLTGCRIFEFFFSLVSKHSKIGIPEINKKINQSSPLHTSTLFDVQYNSIWGARQMSSRKDWK
jgi:hypothetical protein